MNLSTGTIESLVILAGLSGAGKSSALNVFEDSGFFPVDNLPVPLFPEFVVYAGTAGTKFSKVALLLNIDSSTRLKQLIKLLESLDRTKCDVNLVFVDCTRDIILRRYSETRRPHPGFDPELDKTVGDAVDRERGLLSPFKEIANFVVDTSALSIHEFKRAVREFVDTLQPGTRRKIRVNFQTFGFKYGLPPDCDLVADVRFIPNPYFVPELREMSGLDEPCARYVMEQPGSSEFVDRYASLLNYLIPQYIFEGKSYLNVGIGCTGGRHRSVTFAEQLRRRVQGDERLVSVVHRDLRK